MGGGRRIHRVAELIDHRRGEFSRTALGDGGINGVYHEFGGRFRDDDGTAAGRCGSGAIADRASEAIAARLEESDGQVGRYIRAVLRDGGWIRWHR